MCYLFVLRDTADVQLNGVCSLYGVFTQRALVVNARLTIGRESRRTNELSP